MPSRIQVRPQDLNPLSSATDQFLLAQAKKWADLTTENVSPIVVADDGSTTGGDFPRQQPLIVEGSLQQSKELIEFMYKTGHAGATKKAPGPEQVIGGATFAMSGDGTAVPLQLITQDKNPSFAHLGRRLGNVLIVVAATASLTGATLTIASSLSGAGQPLELKIAIVGGTIATAGTPATLTIVGEDSNGDAYTEVVSYDTAVEMMNARHTERFLEVTSITPSGFGGGTVTVTATRYTVRGTTLPAEIIIATGVSVGSDTNVPFDDDLKATEYPVSVVVTPNAAARIEAGKLGAFVNFEGKGQTGEELNEQVAFTSTGQLSAKNTLGFMSEITKITAKNFATGSEITITVQDKATEVTFEPQDEELLVFADVEYTKGVVPFVYRSLCANQASFGITRNSPLLGVFDFYGYRTELYQNLAGDQGSSARKSDASMLEFVRPDIFVGWQCRLSIGAVLAAIIDGTVTINQNLNYSGVAAGTPYEEVRPYRSGKRAMMFEGQNVFSSENPIALDYQENVTYEDTVIEWKNESNGAFPNEFRVEIDESQLGTTGDPASPAFDRLLQPLNIMAFSTQFGVPTDFRIVAVYSEYDRLRNYTVPQV